MRSSRWTSPMDTRLRLPLTRRLFRCGTCYSYLFLQRERAEKREKRVYMERNEEEKEEGTNQITLHECTNGYHLSNHLFKTYNLNLSFLSKHKKRTQETRTALSALPHRPPPTSTTTTASPDTIPEHQSQSQSQSQSQTEAQPRESKKNKQDIILLGIETQVCITQTALDLRRNGHKVYVLADAVSSCNPGESSVALARLRQEGVVVTTSESWIYERLGDAAAAE